MASNTGKLSTVNAPTPPERTSWKCHGHPRSGACSGRVRPTTSRRSPPRRCRPGRDRWRTPARAAPVRRRPPHGLIARNFPVGGVHVQALRQLEQVPPLLDPRADRDHHLVGGHRAAIGADAGDRTARVELKAGHRHPGLDAHSLLAGQGGQPLHRLAVEGEAALTLVQADRQAGCAPVVEQPAHVLGDGTLADDQGGGVAELAFSLRARCQAVERPWMPAPTIT